MTEEEYGLAELLFSGWCPPKILGDGVAAIPVDHDTLNLGEGSICSAFVILHTSFQPNS